MTIAENTRSIEEQFDLFCCSNSLKTILNNFNQLCAFVIRTPIDHPWNIYKELQTSLKKYWKAAALFEKLNKRVKRSEYGHQTICDNTNVVVVGCGPCGLRCAIELALLGARVVVLEKRDAFSRNNVLHLWPYLIEDLKALGAKTFFGKFCAGSIDHISIRALQCILLKVALLCGVQVLPGVTYRGLIEPTAVSISNGLSDRESEPDTPILHNGHSIKRSGPTTATSNQLHKSTHKASVKQQDYIGWRVQTEPELIVLRNFEIDVLIGADGKRSCLGFPSKELRCRLAIAITVNFVNYHTQAETAVEEISGVASIFNQEFFAQLARDTGIDLENIVYYKDETHYFVMTAKKHSLLAKGVLKQDREDSESLLSADNVDKSALQAYARETANYVTNGSLPYLDFAQNARGEPDVDAFDFTRMFAAEYSCRMIEKKQYLLMQCLIGDGLFEPFWPTGSGCALGFLSSLDAAWAVSRLGSGRSPMQVLAERESVYQRLSQTTVQNMPANFAEYTLDPGTRYTMCNLSLIIPRQVRHLYTNVNGQEMRLPNSHTNQLRNIYRLKNMRDKSENFIPSIITKDWSNMFILRWLQFRLSFYEAHHLIDCPPDLSGAEWETGINLLCLLHLHKPDLIPEFSPLLLQDTTDFIADLQAPLTPRRLGKEGQLSPHLIRACGLLIEHFNINFLSESETGSSIPKSNSDWLSYLACVYKAMCRCNVVELRRSEDPLGSPEQKPVHQSNGLRHHSSLEKRLVSHPHPVTPQSPLRVRRENAQSAVEKGILSKRRDKLITALKDDGVVTKRSIRLPSKLTYTIIEPKRWNTVVRDYSKRRSVSPIHRSSTVENGSSVQPPSRTNLLRSHSSQDTATVHQSRPVAVPNSVSRLFPIRKCSSVCYICQKQLYLPERQTAFGYFFHRSCFRCETCGQQLRPERAIRVRAHGKNDRDDFFCAPHASTLSTTKEPVTMKQTNPLTFASLENKLKLGQFPFGNAPIRCDVDDAYNNKKPCPNRHISHQDCPPFPEPLQIDRALHSRTSALLSRYDGPRRGVTTTQQPQSRSMSSSSSSRDPSLEKKKQRNAHFPKWAAYGGPGIRDEDAPGPDCYLAGHLGLPELQRRVNWELNTCMATCAHISIPDLLEHMRVY